MDQIDPQYAQALLADPNTPAATLAEIAAQYRESWQLVAQHPNVYPGLIDWMRQQGFVPVGGMPSTQGAPGEPIIAPQVATPFGQQATGAYTAQPVPGQPAQVGTPGFEGFPAAGLDGTLSDHDDGAPRKKRTGLIIVAAIGVLALIALAVVVPLTMASGSGSKLQSVLKNTEKSDQLMLMILDFEEYESAAGIPFPAGGSEAEIEEWLENVHDQSEHLPHHPFGYDAEHTALSALGGGYFIFHTPSTSVSGLLGSVSSSQLDDMFGESSNGVWRGENLYVTQIDGATYFSGNEGDLPSARPSAEESMASDQSTVAVLKHLESTRSAMYSVQRNEFFWTQIEDSVGEMPDPIGAMGIAFGAKGNNLSIQMAYDFGTSALASDNLPLLEEALGRSAGSLAKRPELAVSSSGSLVVVDAELRGSTASSDASTLYSFSY